MLSNKINNRILMSNYVFSNQINFSSQFSRFVHDLPIDNYPHVYIEDQHDDTGYREVKRYVIGVK